MLAIRPLKDGVIADFEVTEIMLNYFFKKLELKGMFKRPIILICCPSNITSVERNAIRDAAYRSGAKKVYIEEEPKVAAVGAGLDIGRPSGCMVLDIGGGTTDGRGHLAGRDHHQQLAEGCGRRDGPRDHQVLQGRKKLLIGDRTAEEVKKKIGTAWKGSTTEVMEVSGRDLVSGLPISIELNSAEIQGCLSERLAEIVHACRTVLENTPPELAADIVTRGMVLTGGGALLHGLDELLRDELHIPVFVADNALRCVAEGTGILLENLHLVK